VSVELLEEAAAKLGSLRDDVAFLGGAAMVLWITEPAAPPLRPTKDVDVIVEVGSTVEYYRLGDKLRARRFEENPDSAQTCAWRHRDSGLELDVMPTDPSILGFTNEWYPAALRSAVPVDLPSGTPIRAGPPPYLLATKVAAFRGRRVGDYLGSRDFGDIVVLIDGRSEITGEIDAAPNDLREYLAREFSLMQDDFAYESGVAGALLPDRGSQARASLVRDRIQAIVDNGP
jgi:hypothetical protein